MVVNPALPQTFLHSFCFHLLGGSTERDQSMREDSRTKGQVEDNIDSDTFNTDFAKAMIALSQIDVLTGNSEEIRCQCGVN